MTGYLCRLHPTMAKEPYSLTVLENSNMTVQPYDMKNLNRNRLDTSHAAHTFRDCNTVACCNFEKIYAHTLMQKSLIKHQSLLKKSKVLRNISECNRYQARRGPSSPVLLRMKSFGHKLDSPQEQPPSRMLRCTGTSDSISAM